MSGHLKSPSRLRAGRQRILGLSIVELLIGLLIGLFIVGSGLVFFINIDDSRRLMLDARLHDDLRATAELITRDLRRAGFWSTAIDNIATATNPNREVTLGSDCIEGSAGSNSTVSYRFDAMDGSIQSVSYSLVNGVIRMQIGNADPQNLTDPGIVTITKFSICRATPDNAHASQPTPPADLSGLCTKGCTGSNCPQIVTRGYFIEIMGQAASDATVQRRLTTLVRVRNDGLSGACPA